MGKCMEINVEQLLALRKRCEEHLATLDIAHHSQMSIRNLLQTLLGNEPTPTDSQISESILGDTNLGDAPADDIFPLIDALIRYGRRHNS